MKTETSFFKARIEQDKNGTMSLILEMSKGQLQKHLLESSFTSTTLKRCIRNVKIEEED